MIMFINFICKHDAFLKINNCIKVNMSAILNNFLALMLIQNSLERFVSLDLSIQLKQANSDSFMFSKINVVYIIYLFLGFLKFKKIINHEHTLLFPEKN